MKRYIKSSKDFSTKDFAIGDVVTVQAPMGYANYDRTIVGFFTNVHDVVMAELDDNSSKPLGSLIHSKKVELKSLTRNEVLTPEFIEKLQEYGVDRDSVFCDRIKYDRVDRDNGIENIVGVDAYISKYPDRYRVIICEYISKHYTVTRDVREEFVDSAFDPIIQEALDILKHADEVILNYGTYQRIFK